jgi:DNA-binding response OmpR family regulator
VSRPHLPTHLLVIDDDVSIRELLVEYLATRGYRVDGTSDGRIALELMRSNSYDLVLTDYQVPHRDGLDILRVARQASPPLPTIMMTGYGTVETAVYALKEGAADFILKPFKLKRIHEAIQQALDKARQIKADSRLVSTLSLYDFAGTVRDPWQLELLYRQVASRILAEIERGECAVLAIPSSGEPTLLGAVATDDHPSLLAHLDHQALIDALQDEPVLVDDDPRRFFPTLPLGSPEPTWLAARTFHADLSPGASRLAGALLVTADDAAGWNSDFNIQPLNRLAILVGNVVSRVEHLQPTAPGS